MHEISVVCPEQYKDSVVADLINFYTSPNEKVIVVCETQKQATYIFQSEEVEGEKRLVHSKMQKAIRVNDFGEFKSDPNVRHLIMTHTQSLFDEPLSIKLVIFASPPKNTPFYNVILNKLKEVKFVVVVYTRKETHHYLKLRDLFEINFIELQPPDVEDSEEMSMEKDDREEFLIFVKNLPNYITRRNLLDFFGTNKIWIKNAYLQKKTTKDFKFARVELYNQATFQAALKLNHFLFDDRIVEITKYDKKKVN